MWDSRSGHKEICGFITFINKRVPLVVVAAILAIVLQAPVLRLKNGASEDKDEKEKVLEHSSSYDQG